MDLLAVAILHKCFDCGYRRMATCAEAIRYMAAFSRVKRARKHLLGAIAVSLHSDSDWSGHGIGRHDGIASQLVRTKPMAPELCMRRICHALQQLRIAHQYVAQEPPAYDGRVVCARGRHTG